MASPEQVIQYIITAKDITGQVFQKIEAGMTSLSNITHAYQNKMNSLNGTTNGLVSGLQKLAAAVGAQNIASSFINIASSAEKTKIMLEGVMGSAQSAGTAYNWLIEQSSKVPFSIDAMQNAFIKLKTAGLDPMDGSLKTIMDSISFFGGSSEDLKLATLAMQQMAGKGTISMEELRQQLGERIPTAIKAMAAGLGMTMPELFKAIEQGQVSATDGMKAMLSELGKMHGGATDKMMSGWDGLVAQMKTAWYKFVTDVAGAGLFENLKGHISDILAKLAEMKGNGELQEWAERISNAFKNIIYAVSLVSGAVFKFLNAFGEYLVPIITTLVIFKGAIMLIGIPTHMIHSVIAFGAAWEALKISAIATRIGSLTLGVKTFMMSLLSVQMGIPYTINSIGVLISRWGLLTVATNIATIAAKGFAVAAPYLAIAAGIAYLAIEAYKTWKAFDEINQQSNQWAKIADKYKSYAHVVIKSSEELRGMLAENQKAYLEDLKKSQAYYDAKTRIARTKLVNDEALKNAAGVLGGIGTYRAMDARVKKDREELEQMEKAQIAVNKALHVYGETVGGVTKAEKENIVVKKIAADLEKEKIDAVKKLTDLEKELKDANKDRLNDEIKATDEVINGWEKQRDAAIKTMDDIEKRSKSLLEQRLNFNKKIDASIKEIDDKGKTPEQIQSELNSQINKDIYNLPSNNKLVTPEDIANTQKQIEEINNIANGLTDQAEKRRILIQLKDLYNQTIERGLELNKQEAETVKKTAEEFETWINKSKTAVEELQTKLAELSEKRTIAVIEVDISKAKATITDLEKRIDDLQKKANAGTKEVPKSEPNVTEPDDFWTNKEAPPPPDPSLAIAKAESEKYLGEHPDYAKAIEDFRKASDDFYAKQKEVQEAIAKGATEQAAILQGELDALSKTKEEAQNKLGEELNKLEGVSQEPIETFIEVDGSALDELERRLKDIDGMETKSIHRFTIITEGDGVENVEIPTPKKYNTGGLVGGLIMYLARGGGIPGWGGGDKIRALLEPGEFVLRKEAVARFGVNLLNLMNNLKLPSIDFSTLALKTGGFIGDLQDSFSMPSFSLPRVAFADGGIVDGNNQSRSLGTYNLNLNFGGQTIATQIPADQGPMLERLLSEMDRKSKRGGNV